MMDLRKKRKNALRALILWDYLTAAAAWVFFWFYRHNLLKKDWPDIYYSNQFHLRDYVITLVLIPGFWLIIYWLSGTYFDVYKKSRLQELFRSFISSLVGVSLIGLYVFADDTGSFKYFFEVTLWYFILHFLTLLIVRTLYYGKIKRELQEKKVWINTLILGSNGKATSVYNELVSNPKIIGHKVSGLVLANPGDAAPALGIPVLGTLNDIEEIIDVHKIEEVVVALDASERKLIEQVLVSLSYRPVEVKVMPELYDIISGSVRTSNVFDTMMISISPELIPNWQKVVKRLIDVLLSALAILILSPLYIINFFMVRRSSPGPIIYKQERIGLNGVPFCINKFRSMYLDAEIKGPALSSDHDPRITRWGRIMRKWRFDELPQFFNVLKGDMSLVGPRPERKHYIDLITQTHPHYKFLHRVKPGITSWGMVKFGYAENVPQMIERMKYDLLYVENCSLLLDFKIMIFTLKVLFQGRGK